MPDDKGEIVRIIKDVYWHWMDIMLKEELIIDMATDIYGILHKDWDDVQACLFFGNRKNILKLSCPDCGNKLSYSFAIYTFELRCKTCCCIHRFHKMNGTPNCVDFFGKTVDELG